MKKMNILFALPLVALLTLPSCHNGHVDLQAEEEAIMELSLVWAEAIRNNNVDNVVELMAPDVIFMIDDIPIMEGREAVREAQTSWYAESGIDYSTYKSEIVDMQFSKCGDLAICRGVEHYMAPTPEGMVEQWYKFIDIFKKTGDQWKVIAVVGNSDQP
jgi:ketosteroid isomerase-like protein